MAKKKRKDDTAPRGLEDFGTDETRAKGSAEVFYSAEGGAVVRRCRVRVQVGTDYLFLTGRITRRQRDAAERLLIDRTLAGLEARVTVNLLATGGGVCEWSDRRADALRRVRLALGAVTAHECEVILWVTDGRWSLTDIGLRRGAGTVRAARELGRVLVQGALDSLATCYGMPADV